MITNNINSSEVRFIISAIEKEVADTINSEYESAKKNLIEKLDKEKAKSIAGISLHIMKMIDAQRVGDNIVITVRTETKN